MAGTTAKWLNYEFEVWEANTVDWNDASGVYIFSKLTPQGRWTPLYVG